MDYFAFIGHYLSLDNLSQIYQFYPWLKNFSFILKKIPRSLQEEYIKKLPVHKLLEIKEVISPTGRKIGGFAIICPYLPKQMVTLEEEVVLEKITRSLKLAEKLGAKIAALGGFTSIVGDEGKKIAQRVNLAVTSGNTYTAALALEALEKASQIVKRPLSEATVAVIGASGDIGSISAKILATKAKEIILCARRIEEENALVEEIKKRAKGKVSLEKYAEYAASKADFILSATSSVTTIIRPENLKRAAVVCDVSIPPNIAKEIRSLRKDVFVFDGGKASFSNFHLIQGKKWHNIFSKGFLFGCLAEVMILALEGIFENFSLGRGNIKEEKIAFILNLAKKHGFGLAPFHCGDYVYSREDFEYLRSLVN